MTEPKAAVSRLYPTPSQEAQMAQFAGACRFVYNLALEQRRDWWGRGQKFSFASQRREVTLLRAEVDWLKACPVHTLQQALKDLGRAYQNFFAGRGAYPKPHKRGVNDNFRFPDPASLKVERTGHSSGGVDAASRINQARFVCTGCGHEANADTNAAIEILRRADCALKPVEGHRTKRPDEAGTVRRAA